MDIKYRTDCPITSALDLLGDKWMLVIVKQMLFEGKQTFKDFTESDEAIATNILTTKLKQLGALGLITKSQLPTNRKSVYYHLTEKGLTLIPIIVELALWSDTFIRPDHKNMQSGEGLKMMKANKDAFITYLKESYKGKVATIAGS